MATITRLELRLFFDRWCIFNEEKMIPLQFTDETSRDDVLKAVVAVIGAVITDE